MTWTLVNIVFFKGVKGKKGWDEDGVSYERQMSVLLLTTSSRAALRPNEQVSSVRLLMKEVKRSLGRAVKVLRGNMVIRLEMILEMPTASESSISILGM